MSLLSQASLCVTPSAYKEGKLYSVIPSDGAGDMTVVRATTATRVNADGLVELVPYNLFSYSEQFDNAYWIKNNFAVVTSNSTTAPNGTMTADLLISGNSQTIYSTNSPKVAESLFYTFTCYVKYYNTNVFAAGISDFATSTTNVSFNLSTQVVTITQGASWSNTTASMESVGNGWYRCIITSKTPSTTPLYFLMSTEGANNVGGAYIWGAQLNEGTILPYQKTETRLNIPRLDYSNGTCPSLLVEPQRTNFARNNNNLSGWVKTMPSDTITLNAGISPDGNNNSIKIIPSTTFSGHMIYDAGTSVSSSGNFTMSCYAKASGYSKIGLRESQSVGYYATFNLANGTVIDNNSNNATIIDMGNGWYRCIVSVAFSGNVNMGILALNDAYVSGQPFVPYEFAGDGTSGVLIYGPQLETSASYATSLISTAGVSSVTRNADQISKTGISSLIGQTEGTVFVDLEDFIELDIPCLTIDNGTNDNRIVLYREFGTGYLGLFLAASGTPVSSLSTTSASDGKIAIAYTGTTFVMYRNGVQILSTTSAIPNSMSAVRFNGRATNDFYTNRKIKSFALWQTRLTNDQLEQLTGTGFNTYAEMANYYNYTLQ